jgi:hypothetical protein
VPPALRRLRQENHKFNAILGYIERLPQKPKPKQSDENGTDFLPVLISNLLSFRKV